eukprot:snap_masked-scaffold_5-processed-gene-6.26-mRNA-1 protein AED:1.00 eAED:1.00 QI:0/-1/0/0/-1/1/1/0/59
MNSVNSEALVDLFTVGKHIKGSQNHCALAGFLEDPFRERLTCLEPAESRMPLSAKNCQQ